MTVSPALTFGLLLATLYGALAHLILGGDGRALFFYILSSWIGFSIGHGVGQVMGIHGFSIGPINVLTGTLGSIIALVATAFLSLQRRTPRPSR